MTAAEPARENGEPKTRRRIVVDGEVANAVVVDRGKVGDQVESNPPAKEGGDLIPSPSANGAIINFPTKAQFDLILKQADSPEKLVRLRNMLAAHHAAAKHMRASVEQTVQFAVLQLRVDRTIGHELAQHVRPGPVGKRYSRSTDAEEEPESTRLPKDISKNQSSAYQELAAVAESVFEEFLGLAVKKLKPPSLAGALRYAANASGGKVTAKPRRGMKLQAVASAPLTLSPAILDCVQRVMGQIDVCVGDAGVKCKTKLDPSTTHSKQLNGSVFVADCLDPAEWLPKLAKLRQTTGVDQVLVALPAETSAAWFRDLMNGPDEWVCCFPTGVIPPLMLAYLGHHEGFKATCAELGALARH